LFKGNRYQLCAGTPGDRLLRIVLSTGSDLSSLFIAENPDKVYDGFGKDENLNPPRNGRILFFLD
jgi:hypothetical protein